MLIGRCVAFHEKEKQMVVDAIQCDVPVGYIAFTNNEKEKRDKQVIIL